MCWSLSARFKRLAADTEADKDFWEKGFLRNAIYHTLTFATSSFLFIALIPLMVRPHFRKDKFFTFSRHLLMARAPSSLMLF